MYSISNQKTHYPSFYTRFVLAILVAVYIVAEGQISPVNELIVTSGISITLLFSVAIVMVLINYIHLVSMLLDRWCPWPSGWNRRLAYQLLFCTLVPIYLDLVLIKSFLWLFKLDFQGNSCLLSEFPLAKLLIYLMNGWYMKIKTGHDYGPTPLEPERAQVFEGVLGKKKRVFHVKELNYFVRQSGTGKASLADGSIWFIDITTRDMESQLDPDHFIKINRNVILAFHLIDSYTTNSKKGEVILKPDVAFDGDKRITRQQFQDFKTAFIKFVERQ